MLVFLAIGAFFLLTEHTAHTFGVLPYLLFLAYPLMHLFMHGGHSAHGGHAASNDQADHSGSALSEAQPHSPLNPSVGQAYLQTPPAPALTPTLTLTLTQLPVSRDQIPPQKAASQDQQGHCH